jgi:hypothetical protein
MKLDDRHPRGLLFLWGRIVGDFVDFVLGASEKGRTWESVDT